MMANMNLLATLFLNIHIPWLAIFIVGCLALLVAVVIGIGLSILLIRKIWMIQWMPVSATRFIHLHNSGNIDSAMQIAAVSPDKNLKFKYYLDGATLPTGKLSSLMPSPAEPVPVQPLPRPVEYPARQEQPTASIPAAAQTEDGKKAETERKGLSEIAGQAEAKTSIFFAISDLAVSILYTLASLLPGSLGDSFLNKALQLQRTTATTRLKVLQPVLKVKKAQQLQKQVGELKSVAPKPRKKEGKPVQEQETSVVPATEPVPEMVHETPVDNSRAVVTARRVLQSITGVQTPKMLPESDMTLELQIQPKNLYHGGEFTYWLLSQQLEQENDVFTASAEPGKWVGNVFIRQLSWLFWVLSLFLSLAALAFNVAWVVLFIVFLMCII